MLIFRVYLGVLMKKLTHPDWHFASDQNDLKSLLSMTNASCDHVTTCLKFGTTLVSSLHK